MKAQAIRYPNGDWMLDIARCDHCQAEHVAEIMTLESVVINRGVAYLYYSLCPNVSRTIGAFLLTVDDDDNICAITSKLAIKPDSPKIVRAPKKPKPDSSPKE